MRTIRGIVISNFSSAAFAAALLVAVALYCLKTGHDDATRLALFMLAGVIFGAPLITFLECRRVWLRQDENPIVDVTAPALVIGLALFGCSYLV